MLTGYSSLAEYQDAFLVSSNQMFEGISAAAGQYSISVEKAMETAGMSVKDFAQDAYDAYYNEETGFITATNEAKDSVETLSATADEKFNAIIESLQNFNKTYDSEIQKTIEANKALIESYNKLLEAESKAKSGGGGGSNNSPSGSGNNDQSGPSEPSKTPTSPLTDNVVEVEET